MGNTFYFAWEPALMAFLQQFTGPVLVKIVSAITLCGEEMVMLGVTGFLYWCYDKDFAKFVGTGMILGVVWNPLLKNVALRRRPYFDCAGVKCLKPVDASADIYDITVQGYSFPSGHSTNSFVVYGGSALKYRLDHGKSSKLLNTLVIILTVLIGFSRVVLGVHYPTDVLCGWLLGALILDLITYAEKKIKKRWAFHLALFLVSLPGFFFCKTTDYYTGIGMMIGFFLALPFEERFVNFKGTKKLLKCILRLAGGFVLYFGLNSVLKMPFPKDLLASPTLPSFLIRTVRYAIVVFVLIALYPMIFDKIGAKKNEHDKV